MRLLYNTILVDNTAYTLTRKPGVINIDEKCDTVYIYANKVRTPPLPRNRYRRFHIIYRSPIFHSC